LYYFKRQEDKLPYGIIPLENLLVRSIELKGHKHCFELYSQNGEIKSCKLENGQLVRGHHGSYVVATENEADLDNWINAIRNNISFNPLFELIKKRMKDQESLAQNRATMAEENRMRNIDFQEFHDACLMCSMGYKTTRAIKEAYGVHANVIEDTERNMKFYLLMNERAKSQLIVFSGILSESLSSTPSPSPSNGKHPLISSQPLHLTS